MARTLCTAAKALFQAHMVPALVAPDRRPAVLQPHVLVVIRYLGDAKGGGLRFHVQQLCVFRFQTDRFEILVDMGEVDPQLIDQIVVDQTVGSLLVQCFSNKLDTVSLLYYI